MKKLTPYQLSKISKNLDVKTRVQGEENLSLL